MSTKLRVSHSSEDISTSGCQYRDPLVYGPSVLPARFDKDPFVLISCGLRPDHPFPPPPPPAQDIFSILIPPVRAHISSRPALPTSHSTPLFPNM